MLAAILALTATTSGCTPGPPVQDDGGRLAPSIRVYAQQELESPDLSDWDRAVLTKASETGVISQADYDEGADNFEACLKAGGLRWVRTTLLNGVAEFQPGPDDNASDEQTARVQGDCYLSTYARTQELFRYQQANPELLADFPLAIVNCLKKAGMVDDSFSKEDFNRVFGPRDSPVTEWPFDVMDPRAQTCFYSLGYAIVVDAK